MRIHLLAAPLVLFAGLGGVAVACGSDDSGADGNGTSGGNSSSNGGLGGADGSTGGCTGLECNQKKDCAPGSETTLTGKVYDPAGKVPLYHVTVYVPNGEPAPITAGLGAQCDRCDAHISGNPIALAVTDATGSFTLKNIPADIDFPIVMQIGKWRRKVTIPKVAGCQTRAMDAPADHDLMRLPKNHKEGDIPRIALATGGADPLECLFRKIGLEDSEFGQVGSESRVHFFEGSSTPASTPPQIATKSFAAGGDFQKADTLWNDPAKLKLYDIVVLACEGLEHPETKPVAARQNLYDYAKVGGRVFTSHFHHYWFSNSPVPEVKALATWANDNTCTTNCNFIKEPDPNGPAVNATVNDTFEKGKAMKAWLKDTGALTGPGDTLPIVQFKHNVEDVHPGGLSWMKVTNPDPLAGGKTAHEYLTFNTPVGAPDDQVCGRVVYSDLHVGLGDVGVKDSTNAPFPSGCKTTELTPQQRALEFMLFDLSSCIQNDEQAPADVPK
jgi:hypothetical protein